MPYLKNILIAVTLTASLASVASAETTIIRSRVLVSPQDSTQTKTYKIIGPDSVEYVVQAPDTEVQKLVKEIQTTPSEELEFQGRTVQENGVNKFIVTSWQKSTSTTTTEDGRGSMTTTRTQETTTTK